MLTRAGHTVMVEVVPRPDPLTAMHGALLLWRAPYDPRRKAFVDELVDRFQPDVVHVHNFFPQLTYALHEAAHARGVAVVQTLHNYRLLCAAATFERKGKVCQLCLHGSSLNALRHACYRGSHIATAGLVRMQQFNHLLLANVDRFIALSHFAREKFLEGGFPPEQIVIKPNFHHSPDPPRLDTPRSGALFVGRLSPEKGVRALVEAWRGLPHILLTIVGDGPLRAEVQSDAPANVRFLGQLKPDEVETEMRRAGALIVPSICYEAFGMAVVEGFANGLPVIASQIGSLPEIVEQGVTGIFAKPNDAVSLAAAVSEMFANPERLRVMGLAARARYEECYTEARNLKMLEECYHDARATRVAAP
jgi:glycosyltransferase involved in cell wall biosynthesis